MSYTIANAHAAGDFSAVECSICDRAAHDTKTFTYKDQTLRLNLCYRCIENTPENRESIQYEIDWFKKRVDSK